jgi:glycosyltransferase involved in cell wall biosynthesis
MKIVLANKYYFLKGGAERYLFDLAALLEQHGHLTAPFAMDDGRNRHTPWSKYFVSRVQTEHVSFGWQGLRTATRALYSLEAKGKFGRLLDEFKPDLVHVHNIYRQISPSILPEARKRHLPVVATVHDYALLAPNYTLYHDGAICEITRPDRFFEAVGHRCVKHSKAASWLAAAETSLHRRLHLYSNNINVFLAPSRFLKAMMMSYGWPEDRIEVLPHFIDCSHYNPTYGVGDYALYVGRLSPEKGIATLLRAAGLSKDIPLRIVGTGLPAEERRLKLLATEVGAAHVEFRGFKVGHELAEEYANARFVLIPSEWYEVFGLVALEAMARGKAVIASEIGGLPEVVKNGETGVLSAVGDPEHLAGVMSDLWNAPEMAEEMGRRGRQRAETEFSPEGHYQRLVEAYRRVGAAI